MRHQVKFQASLQNQGLLKQKDLNGLGGILLLKVLKNRAAEILFVSKRKKAANKKPRDNEHLTDVLKVVNPTYNLYFRLGISTLERGSYKFVCPLVICLVYFE